MSSRPERVIGHTGTETRSRLLRESAARIFRNGGNPDGATPRGRRMPEGCKVLFLGENNEWRECHSDDVNQGISPG